MHSHIFWKTMSVVFKGPLFKVTLYIKLLACILILSEITFGIGSMTFMPYLVPTLLILTLLLSFRAVYGLDGAHQMNIIIFLGLTFYFMLPEGSFGRSFSIFFIGAQSVLSYVISGIYKLKGASWRTGRAISGIMTTKIYGNRLAGHFLMQTPLLCLLICWFVIGFESFFFLTLVGDPHILLGFLLTGILFHVSNAVLMGLNGFLFAFVATYPAIIYLNNYILAWL